MEIKLKAAVQKVSAPVIPPTWQIRPGSFVVDTPCNILVGITGYGWDNDQPEYPGDERYIRTEAWDYLSNAAEDAGHDDSVDELMNDIQEALDKHLDFPMLKKLEYILAGPRPYEPLFICDIITKAEANLIRKHGGVIWRLADPKIDAKYMGMDILPYCEREIGEIDFDEMIYCGESGDPQAQMKALLKGMGYEPAVVETPVPVPGNYINHWPVQASLGQAQQAQYQQYAASQIQQNQYVQPALPAQALLGDWAACLHGTIPPGLDPTVVLTESQARRLLGVP